MFTDFKPKKGDRVCDVLAGWGTVSRVGDDGTIVVSFGASETIYQPGGTLGRNSRQRLFWQDVTQYTSPAPGDEGANEVTFMNSILAQMRQYRRATSE